MFFTNESVSGPFTTSKTTSMNHYGRRTDVEWLYQLDLDAQGKIIEEKYQSGLVRGIAHHTRLFHGEYFPGTLHPILYNIAVHNVFSDRPTHRSKKEGLVGYHLVPRDEIPSPEAREWWMWKNPWTFDISDRELLRGGTLEFSSDQYLYVLIDGKQSRGKIYAELTSNDGEGLASITKLGEDLWKQQTFTALKLVSGEHGTFSIEKNRRSNFEASGPIRFFRLIPDSQRGFTVREVTNSVSCDSSGGEINCEF